MSSGFITEADLAERKRARQEEWEKVRKPDQPLEAPEEEYEYRSLYERLQAQKQKRDLEYEEAHRLKNMIKGLDDDEVEFLDLVDRSKLEEERKKCLEEAREMAEFRSKVACLQEETLAERIQQEIIKPIQNTSKSNSHSRGSLSSQSKLLAGALVKKRWTDSPTDSASPSKKSKESHQKEKSEEELMKLNRDGSGEENNIVNGDAVTGQSKSVVIHSQNKLKIGAMTCIGILPGLGHYRYESSDEVDSDGSTDIEECSLAPTVPGAPKFDLVGRKIVKKATPPTE